MKVSASRHFQPGEGPSRTFFVIVKLLKALVAAFNKEKALVGAFSVIVKTDYETDGSSAALVV